MDTKTNIVRTGIHFTVSRPSSTAIPPDKITFSEIEEEADTCIIFDGGDFDVSLGILDNIILL